MKHIDVVKNIHPILKAYVDCEDTLRQGFVLCHYNDGYHWTNQTLTPEQHDMKNAAWNHMVKTHGLHGSTADILLKNGRFYNLVRMVYVADRTAIVSQYSMTEAEVKKAHEERHDN